MFRARMIEGMHRGRILSPGIWIVIVLGLSIVHECRGNGAGKYGYFSSENNSYALLKQTVWNIHSNGQQTEFSFRTCSDGQLLDQAGANGDRLTLKLLNGSLHLQWKIRTFKASVEIGSNLNNNQYFTLITHHYLGNLFLNVSQSGRKRFSEIIYNSTFRPYFSSIDLSQSEGLYVGRNFTGCLVEGPNVIFVRNNGIEWNNVSWSNTSCGQSDPSCSSDSGAYCYTRPCLHGTCVETETNYTCNCPYLYNGTNCENDLRVYGCAVQPCLHAGTCYTETTGNLNYRCDCVSGYTGVNCESDIDECGSSPCKNGGKCTDQVNAYLCNCTETGYQGSTCEEDINECNNSVCGNRTCFNQPGSFTCDCPPGQIPPSCDDINECDSSPCTNGGTCKNMDNAFECECVPGFSGTVCETDPDDCVGVTCPGDHTECKDLINNHTCICQQGYTGDAPNCVDINECSPNPCRNSARCNNLVNNYTCDCPEGYTDKNCSTNIDDCQPNPCNNGATCADGVNSYTCMCAAGFTGYNCSTDFDDCYNRALCYYGGTCVDGVDSYTCVCTSGWTGKSCSEDIDECASDPCGIHSVGCSQGEGTGTFECTCTAGYTGSTCEIDINYCEPNPCQNGGTCHDQLNGYSCTCTPDWANENCASPYDACSPILNNCKNGATCTSNGTSPEFACSCAVGYSGHDCGTNIDDCPGHDCTHPFVCYDAVNSYECRCPPGFEGVNCNEDRDECLGRPCQNNKPCNNTYGNYTCSCSTQNQVTLIEQDRVILYLTGFKGRNCEEDINECAISPSICQNGASCENLHGTFKCHCPTNGSSYLSGPHCDLKASYCESSVDATDDPPTCWNGATCQNGPFSYTCHCAAGFTGSRCKIDINECESNPCQYNSTCIDHVNGFTCNCTAGITGLFCDVNINECESDPCQNGGMCTDEINGYTCNCTDTGFNGDHCENNIDDCEPGQCKHNSTCEDGIKDYTCNCYAGYEGKHCDVDINECETIPCHFNSPCLQNSNVTLYEIGYPGFTGEFTYAKAAGYVCECVPGSTGPNCSTNIDDCNHDNCNNGTCEDLLNKYRCNCHPGYEGQYCDTEIDECQRYTPCKHGSTCTDKIADYDCKCIEWSNKAYAGKNCTFELTSCYNDECQNGATCRPYLIDEASSREDYECFCGVGYTGRFCNISTAMSFDTASSYLKSIITVAEEVYLTFRFRTTLPDGVLLAWMTDELSQSLFSAIELQDGNLYLKYTNTNGQLVNNSISYKLNDAAWQQVGLLKNQGSLVVNLTGSTCVSSTFSGCTISADYDSNLIPSQDVYFGSVQGTNLVLDNLSGTGFVGCMEDVTVDRVRLVSGNVYTNHTFSEVPAGCDRVEQCLADSCSGHGTCVDLWNKFRCECNRPYLGAICNESYVAATFGFNNSESFTEFALTDAQKVSLQLSSQLDMSYFFRSRKPSALIMFYGTLGNTFVALELDQGHIRVRVKFCAEEQFVTSQSNQYADGSQRFVRLFKNGTEFHVFVGGEPKQSVNLPTNCDFVYDELLFGGKKPSATISGRRRRDTASANVADFTSASSYKGTLQDVQLNGQSLQFYPLSDSSLSSLPVISATTSSNLEQGEVTDDVCSMISPCDNNATCSNKFFNDYECACLHGYRGKNCSELDFCVTGQCPPQSTCQSLDDGFECLSDATFDGKFSIAKYTNTLRNTTNVKSFSFQLRTLAMNGWILHIGTDQYYYKARLTASSIIIAYKLDDTTERQLGVSHDVSDSTWYTVIVTEEDGSVNLTLYDREGTNMFKTATSVRPSAGENLTTLLQTSNPVMLGNPMSYDQRNPYYQGCLGEVRINNILLPFFNDDLFVNNTSVERFLLSSMQAVKIGCKAGPGCIYSQCRHGSTCVDDYFTYTCNCTMGYTGRWCQDRVDYCAAATDTCDRGWCVNYPSEYVCDCPKGYSGTRCETDINECGSAPSVCQNNGSCQNVNGTYSCDCADGYMGERCRVLVNTTCTDNPCVYGTCNDITITESGSSVPSFNCSCNAGYQGYSCDVAVDYCSEHPCQNRGTCESGTLDYTCNCTAGFNGKNCEVNIDDCTSSSLCRNGGQCVDGVNTYTCNCTQYFDGADCSADVDECLNNPCQNKGLCTNQSPGYSCNCDNTGYEGVNCGDDVDECKDASTCSGHGNCTNTNGSFDCACDLGYESKQCDVANCSLVSCQYNGTCSVSQGEWKCNCLQYYEGDVCEIKGRCADGPCNATNTDQCFQDTTADTFTCNCTQGWTGTVCSEDIKECSQTEPACVNGTCVELPGSFRCNCTPGFTGRRCDADIDECEAKPCQNGGKCINNINNFECNCTGTGYENLTCQEDVDECLDKPCLHGGVCTNSIGSYDCQCVNDYEGKDCEVKKEPVMQDDDITWYIVGPCVAVGLILIVIGVVWFILCVRNKRATRGVYSPHHQEVTGSRVELGNTLKKPPLERLI